MQGANHGVGELGRYKGRHNRIPKKQVDLGKARERRKKNLTEEPLGSQDTEDTPRTMAQTGTCREEALAWVGCGERQEGISLQSRVPGRLQLGSLRHDKYGQKLQPRASISGTMTFPRRWAEPIKVAPEKYLGQKCGMGKGMVWDKGSKENGKEDGATLNKKKWTDFL